MGLFEINFLEWDSNFFSLNVYRLNNFDKGNNNFQKELEDFALLNDVDLIYFESDQIINDLFINSKILKANLVDTKTTFKKKADVKELDSKFIKLTHEIEIDRYIDKVISLAYQSAKYSRFKVDTNFAKHDYKKLYKEWILNSLNKKIANEILFYKIDDDIAGLLTLGNKNETGDIGIVAVDDKYRGQGIAKTMMIAAENWFVENNIKTIQVVTQGNNMPAIALYKSCGYNISKQKYFYHIWKIK